MNFDLGHMSTIEAASYVGGALILIAILWRILLVGAHVIVKIDKVVDLVDPIIAMAEEFKPNGGSSMRDKIDRIDKDHKSSIAQLHAEILEVGVTVSGLAEQGAETKRIVKQMNDAANGRARRSA